MIMPSELLEKQFKSGLGYDRKEVEQFLQTIASDFTILLEENDDLKKKNKDFSNNLAYYKSIEKTLQKALILAEKTAQDTRSTALKEAEAIEKEAKIKAQQILFKAQKQIEICEHKMLNLVQQYELFKINFENLLKAEQELLHSKSFSVDTQDFTYQENNPNPEDKSAEDLQLDLSAITIETDEAPQEQEDLNQLKFDFLKEDSGSGSYQTEDGFEFFTIKD